MRDLLSRLFLAGAVSALLGALAVPIASAAWHTGNTCTSSYGVCVSRDDGNGTPRAVNNGSDSNYSGDFYPNNPDSINNTVSSVRNDFFNRDITFSKNASGGGDSFCLDSQQWIADLGFGPFSFDDSISSHSKSADDLAC